MDAIDFHDMATIVIEGYPCQENSGLWLFEEQSINLICERFTERSAVNLLQMSPVDQRQLVIFLIIIS